MNYRNYRIEMADESYSALLEQLKDVPGGYTPLGLAVYAIRQAKPIDDRPCQTGDQAAKCCGGCSS
jgi:hypothetical protein